METQALFQAVQNFGAMVILALMVIKLPSIIAAISTMIDKNIAAIRDTQTQSLDVFKSENDKILGMIEARFRAMEENLQASVKGMTDIVSEMKKISERVGALERDMPS